MLAMCLLELLSSTYSIAGNKTTDWPFEDDDKSGHDREDIRGEKLYDYEDDFEEDFVVSVAKCSHYVVVAAAVVIVSTVLS